MLTTWGHFPATFGFGEQGSPGKTSSDMRSTCPDHRSLWLSSCSMMDMFLGPKILRLTSVLLILCSHQILPKLRRPRWSKTDSLCISSAFSGQVSEPYSRTERTAAEYTLPFVDNLMSFRCHRWCKLEKASRAFWMRKDNSTAIPQSEVMQLPRGKLIDTIYGSKLKLGSETTLLCLLFIENQSESSHSDESFLSYSSSTSSNEYSRF